MFAIQALCEVDYKEKAKDSMDFLRSIYGISGDKVVVNIDSLSTVEDFKNIKKAMMKQDENENLYREKGEEIDEKAFHSNWVKGLILCAEAYQGELPQEELAHLAILVEKGVVDE